MQPAFFHCTLEHQCDVLRRADDVDDDTDDFGHATEAYTTVASAVRCRWRSRGASEEGEPVEAQVQEFEVHFEAPRELEVSDRLSPPHLAGVFEVQEIFPDPGGAGAIVKCRATRVAT